MVNPAGTEQPQMMDDSSAGQGLRPTSLCTSVGWGLGIPMGQKPSLGSMGSMERGSSPSMLVGMPSRVCIRSCTSRYRWITYASSSSSTNLAGMRVSGETFCKGKEVQVSQNSKPLISIFNTQQCRAPHQCISQPLML